ncbi:MAG: hypothetical protein IKL38_04720 [Firmicutes bacterium]|nr:hypothetical protein [Bacillota bacterium]
MKKESSFRPPVIGASSLLIIFAVLCLTMFTLLSLSTAKANARLSDSSIQAVSDYYEADRQAEIIFAKLRENSYAMPTGVYCVDNVYIYDVPISDAQRLMVELQKDGDSWTVLRWQAVSISELEANIVGSIINPQ